MRMPADAIVAMRMPAGVMAALRMLGYATVAMRLSADNDTDTVVFSQATVIKKCKNEPR